MTVFQLIRVSYLHPRRYPRFKVYQMPLITASSLGAAEDYLHKYACVPGHREDVYAFYIREIPVDMIAPGPECLSERVYGPDGALVDKRVFSSVRVQAGAFEGRTAEEIRFRPGDIVEVIWDHAVQLAFVAAVPPCREEAERINAEGPFELEVSDDSYMVFLGEKYCYHEHVDALRVFSPHFRISEATRQRIEKARRCWLGRMHIGFLSPEE